MLAKVMTVRGVLTPSKLDEGKEARVLLRVSFGPRGFWRDSSKRVDPSATIEIDTKLKTELGRDAALKFISQLNSFIQIDHVAAIDLHGSLLITVETDDAPVVIHVAVRNGKVIYQDSHVAWHSEEVF